jgi:hypothetical protein
MTAERFVIRVEEKTVSRIESAIAMEVRSKKKSFEEPCGVREVPFGWAGIRHGLNHGVLWRERLGKAKRGGTHVLKAFQG